MNGQTGKVVGTFPSALEGWLHGLAASQPRSLPQFSLLWGDPVKRLFVLVMVMLFFLLSALPGFCQVVLDTGLKVYDYADLFTPEEEDSLMEKAQIIAAERRMDVAVVTTEYTYGKSSMEYADDFFDYNGFGYGSITMVFCS